MPRLSLWKPEKSNDYKFFDKTIKEMFIVGATDMYIHKYIGTNNPSNTEDLSQPFYDKLDPNNIQDLLFLENRDRKYDNNIYRIRGHYNVQNLDFDLSQFGLFLTNDIVFITVHYNDMIDIIGRKLMVGDVLELPHLTDYHPLNDKIPIGLRRYYQITDASYASEGFSSSWYPHLWRIKCEPLVDSQEFSNILSKPLNKDNYLGDWDSSKTYPAGYTITSGGVIYNALIDVPVNTPPPNTEYWEVSTQNTLSDILSRYKENIEINNSILAEASRLVPKTGYDNSELYVLPTVDDSRPGIPVDVVFDTSIVNYVRIDTITPLNLPVIRVSSSENIQKKLSLNIGTTITLNETNISPKMTDTGSGPMVNDLGIKLSTSLVQNPFISDNKLIFNTASTDPPYQYIKRFTPRSFGYAEGYLTGTGAAPNGESVSAGTSFPANPELGDYYLRLDYLPQKLFRWDGKIWVGISSKVRTEPGIVPNDESLLSGFINNFSKIKDILGKEVSARQSLSKALKIKPD